MKHILIANDDQELVEGMYAALQNAGYRVTTCSKGTKFFALTGNVVNNGMIEVPMETTLRQVVYDVGGGIKNNREFKPVQTGGPAGGCLPESFLDTPIYYDTLSRAGSVMGCSGMIVINDTACMVNKSTGISRQKHWKASL